MASSITSMDSFLKSIAPDRLVDLAVGGATCNPSKYRVSKHILSHVSDALAAPIQGWELKADQDAFGDRPVLSFPNGKSEAWKLLLFWAHEKRLPIVQECNEDILVLVDAWQLGNDLAVSSFQNAIMLKLLEWHGDIDAEVLRYCRDYLESGTLVARFIAEELVYTAQTESVDETTIETMYEGSEAEDAAINAMTDDLEIWDLLTIKGLEEDCRMAVRRFRSYGWSLFDRFQCGRVEGRKWWMEFMVSQGGKQDGVHSGLGDPGLSGFKKESLAQAVDQVNEDE